MAQENRSELQTLYQEPLSPREEVFQGVWRIATGVAAWQVGNLNREVTALNIGLKFAGGVEVGRGLKDLGWGTFRALREAARDSGNEGNLMNELMPGVEQPDPTLWTHDRHGRLEDKFDSLYGQVLKDGRVVGGEFQLLGKGEAQVRFRNDTPYGGVVYPLRPVAGRVEIALSILKEKIVGQRTDMMCPLCIREVIHQH